MKNYLWKFEWDCDRQGIVEGLFVATEDEIKKNLGKYVSFGEILGKHSDVCGTLGEEDLKKIEVDPKVIEQLIPHLGYSWSGYNPLDYMEYEGEDE